MRNKDKKRMVIFSGAGMSAESGLKTFRDNGGLWENHRVEEVATPQAWASNPQLVLDFYNMRRSQLLKSEPNKAHEIIASWEDQFDLKVITQNIDNLHERAGSKDVLHLHGELLKVRSEEDPDRIYHWEEDLKLGDHCEKGTQLRPHVVWFGESVPMMAIAEKEVREADIFITIGTSLNVYPAASLVNCIAEHTQCYLIDPKIPRLNFPDKWTLIQDTAYKGLKQVGNLLKKEKETI
ncbi:MAG: NAD-dependent protein deacylase [Flavobacteriales bacterium]|nr:NAD-dependent protein deacylase [Flavobacteriales bacterium]